MEEDAYTSAVDVLDDFGGDGVADVVVGAWGVDGERGQAYVVRGPVSGDMYLDEADLVLTGNSPGDRLGHSVSALGDLGGRGLTAFAVTAPGDDSHAPDAGAAYVFTGGMQGRPLPEDAQLTLHGTVADGGGDMKIQGFNDLDGDGTPDLIVARPAETRGGVAMAGSIYMLSVSERGVHSLDSGLLLMEYPQEGFLGRAAVSCDMDGDGASDLVLSAMPDGTNGSAVAGWVGVFPSPLAGGLRPEDAVQVVRGSEPFDAVGIALEAQDGGDLDADGYDDVVVGSIAYTRDLGGGRVSLLPGGVLFNGDIDELQTLVVGDVYSQFFGDEILMLDEDGDGARDLLIGAPNTNVYDRALGGAVYLVHGPFEGTLEAQDATARLVPDRAGEGVGSDLAMIAPQSGWGSSLLGIEAGGYNVDWNAQGAIYLELVPGI